MVNGTTTIYLCTIIRSLNGWRTFLIFWQSFRVQLLNSKKSSDLSDHLKAELFQDSDYSDYGLTTSLKMFKKVWFLEWFENDRGNPNQLRTGVHFKKLKRQFWHFKYQFWGLKRQNLGVWNASFFGILNALFLAF